MVRRSRGCGHAPHPAAIAGASVVAAIASIVIVAWPMDLAAESLPARPDAPVTEYLVRTTADRGAGSLRQAMSDALRSGGPGRIRFDSVTGPFGEPQVIRLRSALPPVGTRLEIDGYIPDRTWRASGVTLQSTGKDRVLVVDTSGEAVLRHVTLQAGRATEGGAVLNRGSLVVDSSTTRRTVMAVRCSMTAAAWL